MNHSSRAYIFNSNGLQGFLVKEDYLSVLQAAHADGLWGRATQWHCVDFDQLKEELERLKSSELQSKHLK